MKMDDRITKILCDNCSFYMPDQDMTNLGYHTACKERDQTISTVNPFTSEDKQSVMDGLIDKCKYSKK